MTFSIVTRCNLTGQFGLAVSSSSPAVAARCAHARAGVGAVASQNVTDPRLGPRALDLMAGGASGAEAAAEIARTAPHAAYRQVLAIGRNGPPGVHSGPRALGIWAEATGPDCAAGGNLLAHDGVPAAMDAAFAGTDGALGARLLAALRAGLPPGARRGRCTRPGFSSSMHSPGRMSTCAATGRKPARSRRGRRPGRSMRRSLRPTSPAP